jgi:23S rRNA pseudouridine2457 synthase
VPSRYLIFNKPFQVLCQFTRGGDAAQRTLADYIAVPGVYPAGRLDFDSEGLLLLTDDGPLQHRLNHPKFAHPRTYWVQVEGIVIDEALDLLRHGLPIQDYQTRPANAKVLDEPELVERVPPIRYRKNIPTSWIEITLTEGRNRQVRRMTAAIGLPTLRLIRVAIGNLWLNDLAPGNWRDLSANEIAELRLNTDKRPSSNGNGKARSNRR